MKHKLTLSKVLAKPQRAPKSRSLKSHREEVRLRQGTDNSEVSHSHWSPSGPCLILRAPGVRYRIKTQNPPQELDSAFPTIHRMGALLCIKETFPRSEMESSSPFCCF